MEPEWSTGKLTDHYEIRSGLSKPASEFGTGYPFLTFKDVFYNYFTPDVLGDLVQSTDKERRGCSVRRGDVFLTRTSETMNELGMSCVALRDYENSTFNGFCKRLRPLTSSTLVPEYVGYYFRSPQFRQAMMAFSTMSTRASLNNEMIGRLEISYPPPDVQKAIASVLKTLDEKIALNRQMNETLEAMAQALFKSWFVDFDPVIDNALAAGNEIPEPLQARAAARQALGDQRKPLSPEIQAQFPSSFVFTDEMGWIPKGWSDSNLGNIVSHRREKAKNLEVTVLSAIASGALVPSDEHFTKQVYSKSTEKYFVVRQWDFAYNPSRINIGSIGMLKEPYLGAVSPVYVVVEPDKDYRWFLQYFLKHPTFKKWVETLASGSVRQSLNYSDFSTIPCVVPSSAASCLFSEQLDILQNSSTANERQSGILTQLRDTLLPKLLSGELRVTDVERKVAEVL